MKTQLGEYIYRARLRRGLNPQQVADMLGYSARGRNKGARRLSQLENTGVESETFIARAIALLDLDPRHARAKIKKDDAMRHKELQQWADTPVEPVLVVSHGPHWFMQAVRRLSTSLQQDQSRAERVAGRYLRLLNCRKKRQQSRPATGHLVWSRRVEIWFDQSGNVTNRLWLTDDQLGEQLPHVQIGNKTVRFSVK